MNMKRLQQIAGAALLATLLSVGLAGCGQSDNGKASASGNSSVTQNMAPASTNSQPSGDATPPLSSSQ